MRLLKRISNILSRKGVDFSAVQLKIFSLNKFQLKEATFSKRENCLFIKTILLHYSFWRSLFYWKLIGKIKLNEVQIISKLVSESPFILKNISITFTLSSNTKIILVELLEKNILFFFQLTEDHDSYHLYFESEKMVWNSIIDLLREHLKTDFLKESYSESKNSIYVAITLPKKENKIPLFNAKIENDGSDLYCKKGKNKLVLNENSILDKYNSLFDHNKTYIPIKNIPKKLIDIIISKEDPAFWNHQGISLPFIGYAIKENLTKRKFSRGASTITMQLVRNLYLNHDRNIMRKIEECIIALLFENVYYIRKEKILEVYLNLIEFAPDVYGIQDASLHYFGKRVQDLTLTEILVLTYIIPRPILFHEALLKQTSQLKQNLNNYIHSFSKTIYYNKIVLEKESFENIDDVIMFVHPYNILILR